MRENVRSDRHLFSTKEEAIEFARKNTLYGKSLYVSKTGVYTIKRYSKSNEKIIGKFLFDPDNNDIFFADYSNNFDLQILKKKNRPHDSYGIAPGHRAIDGDKLNEYIINNEYDKKKLCTIIHKSRTFINDAIRYNRMDILCLETLCDYMKVSRDYFDKKSEEVKMISVSDPEPKSESNTTNDIHDDLITLIASNKKIEALLQELIHIWRD